MNIQLSLPPAGTKIRLRAFQAMLLICPFFAHLNAQITWDGGALTTNWSDPNNWNPDGMPSASDDVTVDGLINVDIPNGFTATAKSLALSNEASLYLDNFGILQIIGSTATYALTLDGGFVTNNGLIQLTNSQSGIGLFGTSSSITNTGTISVNNHNGYGLSIAAGCTDCNVVTSSNMSFDNGTSASSPAVFFGSGVSNGNIIINSGNMSIGATAHAGIGIGLGAFGGYIINTGTINIFNTGGVGVNSGFVPGTLINASAGTINFGTGIGGDWAGGFNLNLNNDGHVNLNKASSPVNVVVAGNGIFGGSEAFSTTNSVGPGSGGNAGCLLFNSGYSNTGTTNMDIGGTTQCSDFDVLFGSTTLDVGGTLNVTLINGFVPTAGQSFTLVNAMTRTGSFSTINYPTVPGIAWTTSYTGTSVIANAVAALPVELADFSATVRENKLIQLAWRTASEVNNAGFKIERCCDGKQWKEIGFVDGHGTAMGESLYRLLDRKPLSGMNYYRLRQMDFDGREELSETVNAYFPGFKNLESIILSPNPTNGYFEIKSILPLDGAIVRIFDSLGRLVIQQKALEGQMLDLSGFACGIYSIEVQLGTRLFVQRLFKQD